MSCRCTCSVLHISVFLCSVRYYMVVLSFGSRWIQGCAGLSTGINIHIFIPGEVLYYGYIYNVIVSYVLFVKILINKMSPYADKTHPAIKFTFTALLAQH